MRVVVDTNQLLRMAAAGEQSLLLMAWRQRAFYVVISIPLLAEFEAVMARPKTQRFLRFGRGRQFLQLLRTQAIFVVPAVDTPACRDPKDDIVIATALGAQAHYIVTADHDLLDDESLQVELNNHNLQILYPVEFLKRLKDTHA